MEKTKPPRISLGTQLSWIALIFPLSGIILFAATIATIFVKPIDAGKQITPPPGFDSAWRLPFGINLLSNLAFLLVAFGMLAAIFALFTSAGRTRGALVRSGIGIAIGVSIMVYLFSARHGGGIP